LRADLGACGMNEQLLLENIRGVLNRLEETILFALIERAQFRVNSVIYKPGALGEALGGESLSGYLLHETEKLHARMRRYTSPDEHPFYDDLPAPILPGLRYDENPLRPNNVNINSEIRTAYEEEIVPLICHEGDDQQYGSSAVCDTNCLQSISRRVHFGKFVAESKYRSNPSSFRPLIASGDARAIEAAITDADVERNVLDRVERKARTYLQEVQHGGAGRIEPAAARLIYSKWIIPLNKKVQVLYLLQRGTA